MTDLDIVTWNDRFETCSTEEILTWTWETFGTSAVVSSSFQTQSVPLLHLVAETCPALPVVFIDTGYHFPETLAFRDELQQRLGLTIIIARPQLSQSAQIMQYGEGLYRRDPDLCCHINKVEPMQRLLTGKQAWISGVRRDQTQQRRRLSPLEPQPSGLLKIHPMLNWTRQDIWTAINRHQLPTHPLLAQGYMSVGCAPCTRPVTAEENERAGRWTGTGKTECGLHLTPVELPEAKHANPEE